MTFPRRADRVLQALRAEADARALFVQVYPDPEQVVDGGSESGRQIVQLVVSDDSAAVLDPADDLLCDVQPDDLELVGELFL